jgi:sugar/nucleoside kinase (ribokinase family)
MDDNVLSRLIQRIRSRKAKVGWDTAIDIYGKERSPSILAVMREVDYLTPSIKEARKISGKQGVEENLVFFEKLGIKAIFLKNGTSGSEISTTDDSVFGVRTREHVPAVRDVKFLDSTGAGDSYSAYIAYAAAIGLSPLDAAQGATVCGALTCERVGGGSMGEDPGAAFRSKMKIYKRQLSTN